MCKEQRRSFCYVFDVRRLVLRWPANPTAKGVCKKTEQHNEMIHIAEGNKNEKCSTAKRKCTSKQEKLLVSCNERGGTRITKANVATPKVDSFVLQQRGFVFDTRSWYYNGWEKGQRACAKNKIAQRNDIDYRRQRHKMCNGKK